MDRFVENVTQYDVVQGSIVTADGREILEET